MKIKYEAKEMDRYSLMKHPVWLMKPNLTKNKMKLWQL